MNPKGQKLRKLARSGHWLTRFHTCQITNVLLFEEPLEEWSPLRYDFVSWLNKYYQIINLEDKPSEGVINDDDLLDAWLRNRELEYKKQKKELEKSTRNRSGDSLFSMNMADIEDDDD